MIADVSKLIRKLKTLRNDNELKNPKITALLIKNLVLFKNFTLISLPIILIKTVSIANDTKLSKNLNTFSILVSLVKIVILLNLILFSLLIVLRSILKSKKISQLDRAFANENFIFDDHLFIISLYKINPKENNNIFNKAFISFLALSKNKISLVIKTKFSALLNLFKKSTTPPYLFKINY
ncbi:hypothetical protein SLITO_v1c11100 [Spiroplasma litorale]|uniref:Transmembrane protein n=1 Tax=Spiroplasma litorale TaxID=216942 RepID=A0A0K1W3F5_9MOLU|nr:hypothetical protein [Spiroplasma litorale]AKX34721.1 hypothetical protein SLITO_v1c11100 [Spiroplasma litorale]